MEEITYQAKQYLNRKLFAPVYIYRSETALVPFMCKE